VLSDNRVMSMSSLDVVVLGDGQRRLLQSRARRASGEHRDVLRARIVLAAAEGATNVAISRNLGVVVDTVRTWRRRFCERGLDGLADQPRSGRPRRFAAGVVAEVKALACELPAEGGTPLAKWSCPDLAVEAARRGIVTSVSASTVRRWLATDALKPWQHRSWIFPRDPDFAVKGVRVRFVGGGVRQRWLVGGAGWWCRWRRGWSSACRRVSAFGR
jgi:transposase